MTAPAFVRRVSLPPGLSRWLKPLLVAALAVASIALLAAPKANIALALANTVRAGWTELNTAASCLAKAAAVAAATSS